MGVVSTMLQALVASVPFLTVVAGVVFFVRALRRGLAVRPLSREKASAKRWVGACAVLMIVGPALHGLFALQRHRPVPLDAMIGCWFLLPLAWFFVDWDRTWDRMLVEGPKRGYSAQGAALLVRFVSGGIVLTVYYLLLLAISGVDVHPQ